MQNNKFTDPALPTIQIPKRQAVMTFTHESAGDAHFAWMVYAAVDELRAAEGEYGGQYPEFTASNGVHIKVTAPPMDYRV